MAKAHGQKTHVRIACSVEIRTPNKSVELERPGRIVYIRVNEIKLRGNRLIMKFNRDSAVYFLAVLYTFVTRYKEVQAEANTEPAVDPVCKPGTYRSVYVGGDCVDCPGNWIFCKNEHIDDVNSCEKACGKLDI